MSIKEHNDLQSIKLKPIISYPHEAKVGKSYFMSIDVELAMSETSWPYPEEEYAISFILETRPFFSYEPLGGHEPSIVLHRFGGTYGPAEYLLTAAREEVPKGTIGITFVNVWGIPIANIELECEVRQEVKLYPQRELTITRKNRSLTPQAAPRKEERQSALASELETVSAAESIMREARGHIEKQLREAGWLLQDYASLNAGLDQGVVVRNFIGLPDGYLLIVNGEQAGVIKVRQTGEPLAGIEEPVPTMPFSAPILPQVRQALLSLRSVLPFVYESTGIEIRFTSYLDPEPRSRNVFTFHRQETLALWLKQAPPSVPATSNDVLRARLRRMPSVQGTGLRNHQVEAITALERSFAGNHQRTLIQMATGSGKTYMAISSIYRLLSYGGVQRVLYLVDRTNLAQQTLNQFRQYVTSDTGRKFTELYHVQHLQANKLDPSVSVYISTIQRLDSMLVLQPEIDRIVGKGSSFEQEDLGEDGEPGAVTYNPAIPIEYFDIIIIDECHRSIYGKWRSVIEYFDAFIIGLTSVQDARTYAFFNDVLAMKYTEEQAVVDGVILGYQIYRIRTQLTENDSMIEQGTIVHQRNLSAQLQQYEQLDEDLIYTAEQLDREEVAIDQIRTILTTYRDTLFTQLFPGRKEVPKTLIFAKNDSHADAIVSIVREIFGRGNEFVRKITYRVKSARPEDLVNEFRNRYNPRIVVSVDMLSTGIDIKPLEVLLFMRSVNSRALLQQMIGLGCRTISDEEFHLVTPDAARKTHFVVVDAVGVTDDLPSESEPSTKAGRRNEYRGLVALSYVEFESFLREQENEYWLVDKQSIEEFISGRPATVEELMQAIAMNGDATEHIYVFRNDALPEEILEATNWEAIPEIKKEDLGDYIIRSVGRGKDFLWFDCTPDEANNGNPAVLLRYEDE